MAADSALAADASPEGLVADASPEGLVADASPAKVRRRVLSYEFIEDVSYGQDSVDKKLSPQKALQVAARTWSKSRRSPIYNLSTVRQMPDDRWRLSAPCHKCESCGAVYQFTGHWHAGTVYCLTVDKAGQCGGKERIAGNPQKYKHDTISVLERERIVAESEQLKSSGRAATTSSVSMRLKGLEIPAVRICEVLQNCRKHWGPRHELSQKVLVVCLRLSTHSMIRI